MGSRTERGLGMYFSICQECGLYKDTGEFDPERDKDYASGPLSYLWQSGEDHEYALSEYEPHGPVVIYPGGFTIGAVRQLISSKAGEAFIAGMLAEGRGKVPAAVDVPIPKWHSLDQ